MDIIRKEYCYPSKSGIADIFARQWAPADSSCIKAVFQIVHGMAEHGERYEEFAKYLCGKGYAVYLNDHLGHGKSVKSDDDLGYFGASNGWNSFVEDARTLTETAKAEHPGRPVVFFGHSMGSFVAREYIRRYVDDVDIKCAIICGTSGNNPAVGLAIKLAGAVGKIKGERFRSKFIDKLGFGAYNKKIENPRTAFDWLTRDDSIVDAYIADKYCGFLFTAAGYKDMFTILQRVSGKDWFDKVNKSLPILLVSGRMDPVGAYGNGVAQVYNDLKLAGKTDVTLKLYDGMRHEILNENGRNNVYEDIASWANSKL